jgi:hypothetical protein
VESVSHTKAQLPDAISLHRAESYSAIERIHASLKRAFWSMWARTSELLNIWLVLETRRIINII